MPQPGSNGAPTLERIKFDPVQLHTWGDRLLGATRDEGVIQYVYEGNRITQEEIGPTGQIEGNYRYDRQGRLDRIEYTDGTSISAKYGGNNELLALTSNEGRSVGFQYTRTFDGQVNAVTPTESSLQFHSAVAVLRMKKLPHWMQPAVHEGMSAARDVAPEIGPDGTIIITIVGDKLPKDGEEEDSGPSGVDFVPIGGSGMGNGGGGGGVVGEAADAIALARREAVIKNCLNKCSQDFVWVSRQCDTGPTLQDRAGCYELGIWARDNCTIACNTGDYMHKWRNDFPKPDYTPWKKNTKSRI